MRWGALQGGPRPSTGRYALPASAAQVASQPLLSLSPILPSPSGFPPPFAGGCRRHKGGGGSPSWGESIKIAHHGLGQRLRRRADSSKGANAAVPTLPECRCTVSGASQDGRPILGSWEGGLRREVARYPGSPGTLKRLPTVVPSNRATPLSGPGQKKGGWNKSKASRSNGAEINPQQSHGRDTCAAPLFPTIATNNPGHGAV